MIVENTDLSDKNIEINLDNYELIDFWNFYKEWWRSIDQIFQTNIKLLSRLGFK